MSAGSGRKASEDRWKEAFRSGKAAPGSWPSWPPVLLFYLIVCQLPALIESSMLWERRNDLEAASRTLQQQQRPAGGELARHSLAGSNLSSISLRLSKKELAGGQPSEALDSESSRSSNNETGRPGGGGSQLSVDEEPADRFADRGFVYVTVGKFLGYILIVINYIYALVFIIGFAGNLSVIRLIFTKKHTSRLKLEKVTDCYIINLALADMMYLIDLPFIIVKNINQSWIFGDVICRLYMSSTSLNQFACSFLLIAMAFDRYLAICHSSRSEYRSLKSAIKICGLIWFISIPLSGPIFTYANKVDNRCTIKWPDIPGIDMALIFTTYGFVIGFALPLLSIGYFYRSILKKLKSSKPTTIDTRNIEIRNKRVERLVRVIIWAYTICWSPYWICQFIISTVDSKYIDRMVYEVFVITTSLAYTNSAINPLIYTFWSNGFCKSCSSFGLLRCFDCCCCRTLSSQREQAAEETFVDNTTVTDCRVTLARTNSNNNHNQTNNKHHHQLDLEPAGSANNSAVTITIDRDNSYKVTKPDKAL